MAATSTTDRALDDLDSMVAALPARVKVDAESAIRVADADSRRLLEDILIELQSLNSLLVAQRGVSE